MTAPPPSPSPPSPDSPSGQNPEWFDAPDNTTGETGLRFECNSCGKCCTSQGDGFVLFTPEESAAIANFLGISVEDFLSMYTHDTPAGRSIIEGDITPDEPDHRDCIFLDRASNPDLAMCSIYSVRPMQCRTWPFWGSNIQAPWAWARAAGNCPGINVGPYTKPQQIRILRDQVKM